MINVNQPSDSIEQINDINAEDNTSRVSKTSKLPKNIPEEFDNGINNQRIATEKNTQVQKEKLLAQFNSLKMITTLTNINHLNLYPRIPPPQTH